MRTREALGVDVGGVIIERRGGAADTSLLAADFLETPAIAGAFDGLRRLAGRFGERVYVVSKCGPRVEAKTRRWLERHAFHGATGIDRKRLHFCRERHEKAPICARLGITHFVDDRLEVLHYLRGIVPHRYLFQPAAAGAPAPRVPKEIRAVEGWEDLVRELLILAD